MEYKNLQELTGITKNKYDEIPFTPKLKALVFKHLTTLDVDTATVSYAGGNDSGSIDVITLKFLDETYLELQEEDFPLLFGALSSPVYEEYKGFAGEYTTTGNVFWHVKACSAFDAKARSIRLVGYMSVSEPVEKNL